MENPDINNGFIWVGAISTKQAVRNHQVRNSWEKDVLLCV